MKTKHFLYSFFLLLFSYSCSAQENRIEIEEDCMEYLAKSIIQNEDYENDECAKSLKNGNDFIIKRNENEYLLFSISSAGKVNKEMIHVKNTDTLVYALYDNGELIERNQYEDKKLVLREYFKDSLFFIEYLDFKEEWMLDEGLAFKSEAIYLEANSKKELLKLSYVDSLGNTRFISDYKSNTSYLYNSKGVLIEANINNMVFPRFKSVAPTGASTTLSLNPKAFDLKPYIVKKREHYEVIKYNNEGKIIESIKKHIDDQNGVNSETYYYYEGRIRKKEIFYSNSAVKTKTFDVNNKLIKETIEIIEEPVIPSPIFDEDLPPPPIIQGN